MNWNLLEEAKAIQDQLVAWRRELHAYPEVGFQLPQTFDFVSGVLRQLGYEPLKIGQCGIVASVGSGDPVILLRADMDGLPVQEASGLPFAAENGNAHVCGHDMHTAMLLGAASLLRQHEASLKGTVKLMFQPAEESLSGASDMIANGLLNDPKPASAMMIHVMNTGDMEAGTVIIPPAGVSAPAADMFEIRLQGKGCHGAMPHNGFDPVNAGAHLVLALQTISTREVSLNDAHALTIACFQAGDTTNVIPDTAVLKGSVRSYDLKTQQFLKERIEEITHLTAQTYRIKAEVVWLSGCPTLVNHPKLVQMAGEVLPQLLGRENVLTADQLGGKAARSVGSEDFSYISQQVPSLMMAMAAGGINELPLHHPGIIFDEKALPYGAAVYAAFAFAQMFTALT